MFLLVMVYVVHAADRGAVAAVLEPIRRDLQLSDAQVGALGGLAYGLAYGLCCLPLGALVDRVNRRNLLAALIAIWSSATLLGGFASTYGTLLASRAAVGGAEAGGGPTAVSILSDLVERERRAGAYGLFYLGAGLGGALSAMLCGWIAQTYSWRIALFVAGGPGLLLALIILLALREPERGAVEHLAAGKAPSFGETVRTLSAQRSLMWIYLGVPICGMSMSVIAAWTIPFLMRSHGLGLASAGIVVGLMLGIGVGASNVASGLLVDRVARGSPARRLAFSTICLALSVPFAWMGYLSEDLRVALPLIFIAEALLSSVLAPLLALVTNLCQPRMRGVAASTRDLLANSIGYGVGPWLAGMLSSLFGGGADALRAAIIITTVSGALIAAAAFLMALRTVSEDTNRAAAPLAA